MLSSRSHRGAVLVGIGAAVVFLFVTTYRLERTGLYYDELHQATGAFAYVGRPTTMFSLVPIGGIPLLTMPYSGAIKTAIYGLYLRLTGRPFSIISWRLLGILLSAVGIVVFCVLAGPKLPVAALVLFLCLLLTDINFLLQSRHDWGPATLAFLLRMIFIGVWLRQQENPRRRATAFVLGLIVGIGIFEKLSSAVLLGPLAVMLLADSRTRSISEIAYALAGVFIGALPVFAVNIHSLVMESRLLALSVTSQSEHTLLEYASNYVALGNGALERRFMFSAAPFLWTEWLEGFAVVSLTLLIGFGVWMRAQSNRTAVVAGIAMLSYLVIGVLLRYLPAETAENHWIIGTPFQYLAIALAPVTLCSMRISTRRLRPLVFIAIAMLISARGPAVVSAFEAIRDDKYASVWDPSVNLAAAFAAGQPENAVIIAADWGIGTQVFCLANGRQDFVFELFWDYRGRETLNRILNHSERQFALVAAPKPRPLVKRQATGQIFNDMAGSEDWAEIKLDPWVYNLRSIEIRAFRRTGTTVAAVGHGE